MGTALAHGDVSRGHVDVAVATLDKVPSRLRRECAATIDAFMVTTSRQYRPTEVANLAREILDRIDPDRHERGYDTEAFTHRSFTLRRDAYGMGLPSGQLDPMTYALVNAALQHYSARKPAQTDEGGRLEWRDDRTPAQRRCDALAEMARRALAAAGTGGETTTRNGVPHVLPPAWLDADRKPVRNLWWQDRTAAAEVGRQLAIDLRINAGPPPDD